MTVLARLQDQIQLGASRLCGSRAKLDFHVDAVVAGVVLTGDVTCQCYGGVERHSILDLAPSRSKVTHSQGLAGNILKTMIATFAER